MTTIIPLLLIVLAILARTQTVFRDNVLQLALKAIGGVLLLVLPAVSVLSGTDLGERWRDIFYHLSMALSFLALVMGERMWERSWPLILTWAILPLVYGSAHLDLWLSMLTAEFLLLLAYYDLQPGSRYHKASLLRMLFMFQFFVFENLFLQERPLLVGQVLTSILLLLYLGGFWQILVEGLRKRRLLQGLFLLVYTQYGVMLFDKLIRHSLFR